MSRIVLSVRGATKTYRGATAVKDADFDVEHGHIHGLIGPNGAGKTTLLNIINGYATPDRGRVSFEGRDITDQSPAERARLGFVRTFQDCRLLEDLSIADNLWLGGELARRQTKHRRATRDEATAYSLIESLGLQRRLDVAVRDLSSGERKTVEVGRALIAGGRLVLLDEPFSGLTRAEVDQMVAALRTLRSVGDCSVVIVEHNLGAVFELCDSVTAMDRAAVLVTGSAEEVRDDHRVRLAFFGTEAPAEHGATGAPKAASVVGAASELPSEQRGKAADHALLSVRGMHSGYGRVRILHGVDMDVPAGAVTGLIGANGAGKSTLFRSIMGLASVSSGEVYVDGKRLTRLRADHAVRAGIGYCPQGRHLFPTLTVEDNLRLGARVTQERQGDIAQLIDETLAVLPGIADFRKRAAGSLSGGQQQLLAIGRALMSRPKVLLLDEPSTGLAVGAIAVVGEALRHLAAQGIGVVLAEQNITFATSLCVRGYVIESGVIVAEGDHEVLERAWELTVREGRDAAEVADDPDVTTSAAPHADMDGVPR